MTLSRTRSGARRGREEGSFWICYSDLMSALLLVFILIMFYSVYLYYDMLEVKTKELLVQSGLLTEKEAALEESKTALEAQSAKLSETETALLAEQAKLLLQQQTLDSLQARLDEQESALAGQQVTLDEALAAYNAAKDQLDVQQDKLDAQQVKLDKLVGVRTEIIDQLIGELSKENITGAKVDESGAIVFDSEMMFDKNMTILKDRGKVFLGSFIPNYLKVLMSDQYAKYVSQIIIEGHTDSDGTYISNMKLSQERAYAVLSYLLSYEFSAISDTAKASLRRIVTVNGRADSDPILNADGSENMDASRRVVIKFRLNDEDMVDEMIRVLEDMN